MKTINYRGIDIKIIPDKHCQSPDDWGNDDMFLVYDHRQFTVERDGYDPEEIFEVWKNKNMYDGYWIFPVYAYIHSGVALSLGRSGYPFNDRWDTSFRGFALVQRMKGWSYTKEKAYKRAEALIEEWNDYLSGNVYGYNIEQTGDSCWRFYGDYDIEGGCLDQAKSCVDHYIKRNRLSHFEKLKAWIKNKVPLYARSPIDEILLS